MNFGDYASNSPTPAYEIYFAVTAGYLAAANTQFYIGSYTMRFAGQLYVDTYAQVTWPGTNTLADGAYVALTLGSSTTPAPPNNENLPCHQDAAGVFAAEQEIRTVGAFYNLTAGQVVTAYANLYTNVTNSQVYVRYIGGNFRPHAA
jgi:hypothetical protein